MGKKATKATKKFASSGQLKKVIQARHKHRQILKRSQGRRGAKEGKERAEPNDIEEDGEEKPIKRFARCVMKSIMLMPSEANLRP